MRSDDVVPVEILVDGDVVERRDIALGQHDLTLGDTRLAPGRHRLEARANGASATAEFRSIRGWLSILPPVIAISLALIFKDVLVSLFAGVFSGALILAGWNPFPALARTVDTYVVPALADRDHAPVIVFSCMLGGMVGIISRSGGTQGIVDRLRGRATTPRRGQLATWVLGVLIFFDDYANTLIVGSTMRPITDRLRISREKLAYIVDSTAAPVVSIVPISTWIGFEIGLIAGAFGELGLDFNPYGTLVASIPFRFYPIFALVLGFTIALSRRDFGPMLKAERRARATGQVLREGDVPLSGGTGEKLEPPEGAPRRAINALAPILTVIVMTLVGLFVTGKASVDRADFDSGYAWLREVFANSDSFSALLWASLSGVLLAAALALTQRILDIKQTMFAMVDGFRAMLLAFVVLILAWSIGAVCQDLQTADYVVGLTGGVLSPYFLPVLVFLASAAIAFATGASWGTMAILYPIVIPICHALATGAGFSPDSPSYWNFLVGTIGSILAGSVWGDHCSPISDTTILSSMASGCDHIAHVRTHMPYAVSIGLVGMLLGNIPTAYGMSPWASLGVGSAVIVGGVLWLGRLSGEPGGDAETSAAS